MLNYFSLKEEELERERENLQTLYDEFKLRNLSLNMARGKPSVEQTNLSLEMYARPLTEDDYIVDGIDCRNYGCFDGLPSVKKLLAPLVGLNENNIFVGGNSSLNLMFGVLSCFYTHGVGNGCQPWGQQGKIKFLCPVPGYDRHFSITKYFNIEMICIKMDSNGPDMDTIEDLVSKDSSIKGIWCVPKYSNPSGITYSDDVVRRFATLKPKAKDFRIFWDNAYAIHDLQENGDTLLNIMDECRKNHNEDLPIIFSSTSKITFPAAGVAIFGASDNNMKVLLDSYKNAIISFNKINQLLHLRFLKTYDNMLQHMRKHRKILKPKFDLVNKILTEEFSILESDNLNNSASPSIAQWNKPKGGYFVSVNVLEGTAKRVVELCKNAGVILTNAGATFPYGQDENDTNIRIAPSYPPLEELKEAMTLFCICVKLAAIEKIENKIKNCS